MLTCSDFSLSSSESSGVSTVVRWSQVLGNHVGRSSVVVGWADCLSNPGFVDVVHQRRRRKQENDQLTILFSSESVSLLRAWFSGELFPLSLLLSFWALFSTQPFRGGEHSWLLKSHWRWRHVELVLEKEGLFCRVSRPSHAVGISWLREKWSSVWLKLQPELRLFYSHISVLLILLVVRHHLGLIQQRERQHPSLSTSHLLSSSLSSSIIIVEWSWCTQYHRTDPCPVTLDTTCLLQTEDRHPTTLPETQRTGDMTSLRSCSKSWTLLTKA